MNLRKIITIAAVALSVSILTPTYGDVRYTKPKAKNSLTPAAIARWNKKLAMYKKEGINPIYLDFVGSSPYCTAMQNNAYITIKYGATLIRIPFTTSTKEFLNRVSICGKKPTVDRLPPKKK